MSTERLNQSGDRIKESKKVLLQTEELGVSILQDLHQQRQTLLHATDTVRDILLLSSRDQIQYYCVITFHHFEWFLKGHEMMKHIEFEFKIYI